MKTFSAAAIAALAAGDVVMAAAARFSFGAGTHRLWSGEGQITLADGVYTGIGGRGLVAPISAEAGGGIEGVVLALDGLDPAVAATIEAEDYHQRPVLIQWLLFDAPGVTLLDAQPFFRGRVDTIRRRRRVGDKAAIEIAVEGGARDMARHGSRLRSWSDQLLVSDQRDNSLRRVTTAGQVTLYWGQKPASANALNGGVVSGGYTGAGGFGGFNLGYLP